MTIFQFLMENHWALWFPFYFAFCSYLLGKYRGRQEMKRLWKEADLAMARADKIIARNEKAAPVSRSGFESSSDEVTP